jgi:hypothetical protein
MCVDFRALKKLTIKEKIPIRLIDDLCVPQPPIYPFPTPSCFKKSLVPFPLPWK